MLESENLQKKYGRKWMLSKMLSFIMLLFKKKVINACVKSVTLPPFKAGFVLASGDILNQHYLPITCAIKRLEDVKQALSTNRCTSMSDLRGSVFLSMALV